MVRNDGGVRLHFENALVSMLTDLFSGQRPRVRVYDDVVDDKVYSSLLGSLDHRSAYRAI